MKKLLYRTSEIKLRVAEPDAGQPTKIIGRAIVYNSLSRDLGGFVEKFLPGAVTASVSSGLVCALLNHNTGQSLGTQQAGTLKLTDGPQGLDVEIDIPDTSYARDAIALMSRGDGTGMSFGFYPTDCEWSKDGGLNICTVKQAELGEVSVLTGVPAAYAATSAALRSLSTDATPEELGIDLQTLASVFCAIKRSLPLDSNELACLQSAKELFGKAKFPALEAAVERARKYQLI